MMDALFDLETTVAAWVVRGAVDGKEYYRGTEDDCEAWANVNRDVTWLVIEQSDQCLSMDEYVRRGMLRNYPGEGARGACQLDLFRVA